MECEQATKIVRPRLAKRRPTAQWLAMQYVVSRILVEVTTREEAFRRTLQTTGEVLGCEAGAFWTIDQTANVLHCNTIWHTPAVSATMFETVSMQTTFPPGVGLPGLVWATGQPAWIPDVLKDTNSPRYKMASSENLHGAFAFPVYSASGFLGVIEFFSRKIQQADDELIRAVITIGNQLGQFIEKKRLEEEARENEWRYRALFEHELALREAKRRMDEFLSIASHELKTPLTAIKTSIQLAERYLKRITPSKAEDGVISKLGETQELLRRAGRQIDVINRLVSDLIDISRIDADKLTLRLHPEPCDVATIVREVVNVQRRVIFSRPIHLKISTRKALPVIADVDRIAQVLANYLSNAHKYSLPERPIEVSLRVKDGVVRVAVRDEGPGLPPSEQKRVWERFYRAEGVENQGSSGIGLGLGLYISRMIIEQHHGQVGVESAPGKGSTFWFTLPLAPVI
jgi:signal transduction histidine kinase